MGEMADCKSIWGNKRLLFSGFRLDFRHARKLNKASRFGQNKSCLFSGFRLDFRHGAEWNKASRFGEEKRRSSKESFCKSNLEERFAHRREICDSGKPLKRGLLTRPILIKTPTFGAFRRTSAFRPPAAYFNRQAPRTARHAASVRNILSSRKLRKNKRFLSSMFRLDIVRTGA